ncbi:MAG: hypothetical protein PHX93_00665 [Candidatus Peribacteraceae bacterium]|jgi:hypothetical protein|nr:hypothetical protein [Candidatus Peribacteraceae bacterium]
MTDSNEPDFLQVVGGQYESFHEVGNRLFAYFYAVAIQLGLTEGLQELAEEFSGHPELSPILGYASMAREQAFAVFSRVPEEQAILIWYHGVASAAQRLVSTMRIMGYVSKNAPLGSFLTQIDDRICDVFQEIRTAIDRMEQRRTQSGH